MGFFNSNGNGINFSWIMNNRLVKALAIFGASAAIVFLISLLASEVYTEYLWFDSLGLYKVFETTLITKVILFTAGTVAFSVLFSVNVFLAWRFSRSISSPPEEAKLSPKMIKFCLAGGGIILSLIFGWWALEQWEIALRFLYAVPFGSADPVFDREVAFYVFSLPLYYFIKAWMLAVIGVIFLAVISVYYLRSQKIDFIFIDSLRRHLSFLGAVIILFFGFGFWLDIFGMNYSSRGVVFGAGYADINAQLPALKVLITASVIGALALIVGNLFLRKIRFSFNHMGSWNLFILTILVYMITVVSIGGIYPHLIQRSEVAPNEYAKELPYIQYNIQATQTGYALDKIEEQSFSVQETVSGEDIQANPGTVSNIRIWDQRPLIYTYNQNQAIRLYYDFKNIDTDRYLINGRYLQVFLALRELSQEKLDPQAQTWTNKHLVYTHGYGIVMSQVNEVTSEGLPVLLIKDIPPSGVVRIDRPEVYYGENTQNYAIVDTGILEFDYPRGKENVYSTYASEGGVALSSFFARLAYALKFKDINILISGELTPRSRILYYRNIVERVKRIAPFLLLDRDPYPAIIDGRLVWIQDAYTITDRYPYSQPLRGLETYETVSQTEVSFPVNEFPAASVDNVSQTVKTKTVEKYPALNYIRNSVKITIDAYDGSVRFYISDSEDPIIQTYDRIFPDLLLPMAEMSDSLRAHIRYPLDLFSVQAEMYKKYHMGDPKVFYGKEDTWASPKQIYGNLEQIEKKQVMKPYFTIMRFPGEEQEELILIMPFTPVDKDNAIAWLAARSDGEHYGKLFIHTFPKDQLVYGPMQIESRIVQDTDITQQFALWGAGGSQVIRGNLLMIPIGESYLYVESVYLQSAVSKFPQLKRVIVVSGERIVMAKTLRESLDAIFGQTGGLDVSALIDQLSRHFEAALKSFGRGDWEGFSEEMKIVERIIKDLQKTN